VGEYVELATGRPVRPGVARAIHGRTEGNPFLVGEVVRALDEQGRLDEATDASPVLPETVRDVIGARLDGLDPSSRAVLDAAAVVGREFGLALVARAAGVGRLDALEALEPAVGAHLVAPLEPPRCRFAHAIVRDVVYDHLAPAGRARLHAVVGRLLEERRVRGEPQPVAEIAHHLLQAARAGGEPEAALEASVEAAREAGARLAHAEAASHYEGALEAADLGELAGDERRCRLLVGLAEARRNAGDLDEAQRRYGDAAALARRRDSADLLAEAALGYAEWQLYGVVDHAAIELLQDALDRLPERDSSIRAGLLGLLAVRLDPQQDQARREALLGEAIAMARRLADPPRLTRLLCLSPLVHWKPESAERRSADAAEAIALARDAGDLEAALWAHTIRYTDAFGLGDMPAADAELEAFARLAGELRQPYYRWSLTVLRGTREIFAGRFEEGRRLATEAIEHNRAHEPDSEQEYTVQMLMLAAAQGRPEEGDADMLRHFAEEYPGLPMWRALVAYVEWVRGEEEAAREVFEELARSDFTSPARDPDAISTLSFAAEVCAGLGDARRAAVLHDRLLPYRDRNVLVERGWGAWGAAAHQLGLLAASMGQQEQAAEHFERALELNRRWGARPWVLRTLRAAGAHGVPLPSPPDEARALAAELGLSRSGATPYRPGPRTDPGDRSAG
jgi:tetratricopeptide (TPR) repeat protein